LGPKQAGLKEDPTPKKAVIRQINSRFFSDWTFFAPALQAARDQNCKLNYTLSGTGSRPNLPQLTRPGEFQHDALALLEVMQKFFSALK